MRRLSGGRSRVPLARFLSARAALLQLAWQVSLRELALHQMSRLAADTTAVQFRNQLRNLRAPRSLGCQGD